MNVSGDSQNKTLLVSLQGIGNTILALPLARALHRREGVPVSMLVHSPRIAGLLEPMECVGEVIAVGDPSHQGARGKIALVSGLRKRNFQRAVLAYPSGDRSILLAFAAGIGPRIGLRHWTLGGAARLLTQSAEAVHGRHDLENNQIIAELCGAEIDLEKDWPPLDPSRGNVERARAFLSENGFDPKKRYLGLHPGCDGDFIEKRWPERNFAACAEAIHKALGLPAVVFDGPQEPGAGQRIARLATSPVLPMNGWGDLPDALGMLSFCDLFISNDSGLMNLAAAAGVKTLGLFGPSVSSRTRPFGKTNRIVTASRPCVPCFDMEKCPGCLHAEWPCMNNVSPESVVEAALEMAR